jgi:hypothetical protein
MPKEDSQVFLGCTTSLIGLSACSHAYSQKIGGIAAK